MKDLPVASFMVRHTVNAVPREDCIVHVEGTPLPKLEDNSMKEGRKEHGESILGLLGANLLASRRRFVLFRARSEH